MRRASLRMVLWLVPLRCWCVDRTTSSKGTRKTIVIHTLPAGRPLSEPTHHHHPLLSCPGAGSAFSSMLFPFASCPFLSIHLLLIANNLAGQTRWSSLNNFDSDAGRRGWQYRVRSPPVGTPARRLRDPCCCTPCVVVPSVTPIGSHHRLNRLPSQSHLGATIAQGRLHRAHSRALEGVIDLDLTRGALGHAERN